MALKDNNAVSEEIKTRKELIISKCLSESVDSMVLKRAIMGVLGSSNAERIREPPKTVVANTEMLNNYSGKVTFVKFNKTGKRIAMVSESSRDYTLSIWEVEGNNIELR